MATLSPNLSLQKSLDFRGVMVIARARNIYFVSRCFLKRNVDENRLTGFVPCELAPYWAQNCQRTLLNSYSYQQEPD